MGGGVCFPATSASSYYCQYPNRGKKSIEREGGTPISPTLIIKSKSKFKSSLPKGLPLQVRYIINLDKI
jgi:hypothetical protein